MKRPIEKSLLQYGLTLAVLYQLYQSIFDALINAPLKTVAINIVIAIFLLFLLILLRFEKSVNIVAILLHLLLLPAFVYFWHFNGEIMGITPFILCVYFGFIISTTNGFPKWLLLALYSATLIVLLSFPQILGTGKAQQLNLSSKPIDFFIIALIITAFTIYLKNKYMFYRNQVAVRNNQLQRVAITLAHQNEELQQQREEIKAINENLENLIVEHTRGIESRNKELSEYAFINAHMLRAPLSRILGLAALMEADPLHDPAEIARIKSMANEMDQVIRKINEVLI